MRGHEERVASLFFRVAGYFVGRLIGWLVGLVFLSLPSKFFFLFFVWSRRENPTIATIPTTIDYSVDDDDCVCQGTRAEPETSYGPVNGLDEAPLTAISGL